MSNSHRVVIVQLYITAYIYYSAPQWKWSSLLLALYYNLESSVIKLKKMYDIKDGELICYNKGSL